MTEFDVIDLTSALTDNGKQHKFTLSATLQNDLLSYPDAYFVGEVTVCGQYDYINPVATVQGVIDFTISALCDRCCDRITKQFLIEFNTEFSQEEVSEEECYLLEGTKLNIQKAVEDEIVLALPISILCQENCKGLCPKCGINLNKSTCSCDTAKGNAFSVLKNIKF